MFHSVSETRWYSPLDLRLERMRMEKVTPKNYPFQWWFKMEMNAMPVAKITKRTNLSRKDSGDFPWFGSSKGEEFLKKKPP